MKRFKWPELRKKDDHMQTRGCLMTFKFESEECTGSWLG